jgi:hypothetical protein
MTTTSPTLTLTVWPPPSIRPATLRPTSFPTNTPSHLTLTLWEGPQRFRGYLVLLGLEQVRRIQFASFLASGVGLILNAWSMCVVYISVNGFLVCCYVLCLLTFLVLSCPLLHCTNCVVTLSRMVRLGFVHFVSVRTGDLLFLKPALPTWPDYAEHDE